MAVLGGTQIISNQVGGGSGGAGRSGALPEFGNYTLYISGGTTYARNNLTGAIDSSNADAAVVINATIANMPNGGTIFFKNGVYNLNSLILETAGGFTHYYAIGIPSGGSTQYSSWWFEGESFTPVIDQFGLGSVQTNGVILNLTTTAENSVAGGSVIFAVWARPDTVNHIGATVAMKKITVRLPSNQRGNETAVNLTQALISNYEFVTADFNTAWGNLAFPVAGTSGLFGLTTTASSKEQNYMKNTYAAGYDVCLDIQSEHAILENSYGLDGNHGIDYGVRGGNIYHAASWLTCGWGECARGLTLGANCQPGSFLTIVGLDIEDATAAIFPAFLPVYHVKETTAGNTNGLISYSVVTAGVGTIASPPWLFDGGGGTNFMVSSGAGWTSAGLFTVTSTAAAGPSGNAVALASDNFTRVAENPLSDGGNWTAQTGSTALKTTGTAVEATATGAYCNTYWNALTWSNDQYAELTLGTITGTLNVMFPAVRMATGANTGYYLEVQGPGTCSIVRVVAGTPVSLVNVTGLTFTTGDVFRIQIVGSHLTAYQNGTLILRTTDTTLATGVVGFGVFATDAIGDITSSLWTGGTVQALTLGATTAASATAGGNGDVPAQVVGYLNFNLNGTPIKVPYYAA